MGKYKISAYHNKGYDLQFEELYLTSKGVESFRKQFEEKYPTEYIQKNKDGGYDLEGDIVLEIVEYKEPIFEYLIEIKEISVSDEGYEMTWLSIE